MTAQIHDRFILDKESYSVVGIKGGQLFTPQIFGLVPMPQSSACWRGYMCEYALRLDSLVLDRLSISLGTRQGPEFVTQQGPEINSVKPAMSRGGSLNVYEHLNLPMPFSGGILIAQHFIDELYVHMGFHPAWKYSTVIELLFDNGHNMERRNVSAKMQEIRDILAQKPLQPGPHASRQEVDAWIEATFTLNYNL